MQRTILMDFKKRGAALEWRGLHDLEAVRDTRDGIEFLPSGPDPFATGPVVELPSENPHWLIVRLRSTAPGMLQDLLVGTRKRARADGASGLAFPCPAG